MSVENLNREDRQIIGEFIGAYQFQVLNKYSVIRLINTLNSKDLLDDFAKGLLLAEMNEDLSAVGSKLSVYLVEILPANTLNAIITEFYAQ